MFKDSIDNSPKNSKKISQKLEQVTFNSIRKFLPDHTIIQAGEELKVSGTFIWSAKYFIDLISLGTYYLKYVANTTNYLRWIRLSCAESCERPFTYISQA